MCDFISYDLLDLNPSLPNIEKTNNKKYFTIILEGDIKSAIFSYLSKIIIEKKHTDFNECILTSSNYERNYDDNDEIYDTKVSIEYALEIGRIKLNYLDGEIIIDKLFNNTVVGTRDSATILKITKLYSDKGIDHITKFLQMCVEDRIKKNGSNTIRVKTFDETCSDWSCGHNITKRGLESIYIPEKDLNGIIFDMKNFFNNKDEYKRLGIPFRRNYLLYGPPGTGKTSTITALASFFNLGISTIVLGPTITDTNLIYAITYARNNNIILLEDIDSIIHAAGQRELQNTKLTFSTLLNILDGHIRKQGSIVFMTTNFREKVKGVLDRPGRVDYELEFKKMRLPEIKKMIGNFFNKITKQEVGEITDLIKSIKPTPSAASLQKFLFYIIQKKNGISFPKSVEENLNILNEIISIEIERGIIDKGNALVM